MAANIQVHHLPAILRDHLYLPAAVRMDSERSRQRAVRMDSERSLLPQQRDMPGSSLAETSPGMQGSRLRVDRTRRQIRRPTTTVHMQVSSFQMVRMLSLIVRVEHRRLRRQAADSQTRQQISLLPADRRALCQTRLLPGIGTGVQLQAIPAYVTGGFLPISQCGRRTSPPRPEKDKVK